MISCINNTYMFSSLDDNSEKKEITKSTKLILLYKNLREHYQIKRMNSEEEKYWYVLKKTLR